MTKRTGRDRIGSPLPSKLRIPTPSGAFKKGAKDQRLVRPQRALRSPENPTATLDTLASQADDVRYPRL